MFSTLGLGLIRLKKIFLPHKAPRGLLSRSLAPPPTQGAPARLVGTE
jgi:hypothetical protein